MSCQFCQEDEKEIEKLIDELEKVKQSNITLKKQNDILWRANEVTQHENHDINTKIEFLQKSWAIFKKQQIEENRSLYQSELGENPRNAKGCWNCVVLNTKMKQERKRVTEKETILQEKLDRANKVILELENERNMLYITIEKERGDHESIKTKLEQARKQTEKELELTEKELEKTKKVLEGQQRDMNKIKQISKASFIKVRGSHTLDDVESYKKDIAKAQFAQQEISKRTELLSFDKSFEIQNARRVRDNNDDPSNSFSDALKSTGNVSSSVESNEIKRYSDSSTMESSESSPITVNKRKNKLSQKSSKTIISANHVHISNVPTFNNYDKD